MKYSLRFWALACVVAILLFLLVPRAPMVAAGNHVVLIMGGDVEWSLNSRPPTVRYPIGDPRPFGFLVFGKRDVRDQVIGDWPPIPYVNEGESKTYLESLGLKGGSDDSFGESLSYPLQTGPEFTQEVWSSTTRFTSKVTSDLRLHGSLSSAWFAWLLFEPRNFRNSPLVSPGKNLQKNVSTNYCIVFMLYGSTA